MKNFGSPSIIYRFSRRLAGQSWTSIKAATGCSRATVAKIAKRIKQAA
jgi:hypothetical protein